MLRFIRILLAAAAGLAIVLFSIANREIVDVSLWPLPATIDLPLYGVFLAALLLGALLGGIASWLAGWRVRRDARRDRRRVVAMEARERLRREEQARAEAEELRQRRESRQQGRALAPAGR